jgi:hypothetical protein
MKLPQGGEAPTEGPLSFRAECHLLSKIASYEFNSISLAGCTRAASRAPGPRRWSFSFSALPSGKAMFASRSETDISAALAYVRKEPETDFARFKSRFRKAMSFVDTESLYPF